MVLARIVKRCDSTEKNSILVEDRFTINRIRYFARGLTRKQRRLVATVMTCLLLVVLANLTERGLSRWVTSAIVEHAKSLNLSLATDGMSVHALRITPRLDIQNLSIAAVGKDPLLENTSITIRLSWWELLTGFSTIQSVQATSLRVNLLVDEHGEDNWTDVVAALQDSPSEEGATISVDLVEINGGQLEYIHDVLDQTGEFTMSANWKQGDSWLDARMTLNGDINYLPVELTGSAKTYLAGMQDSQKGSFAMEGKLATLDLRMTGSTDDIDTFAGAEVEIDIQGQELNKLLDTLRLGHTDTSHIELWTSARYGVEDTLQGSFELALDSSTIDGQLLVEDARGAENVWQITAKVNAHRVFLDTILGSTKSHPNQGFAGEVEASDNTAVFSDRPIGRFPALDGTNIDVEVSVDTLYKAGLRVNDLHLSLIKDGNNIQVSLTSDDFGQGTVQGNLSVVTSEQDMQGRVSAQINRVRVGEIISLADLPEGAASGRLSGDAKFWVTGNSVGELASSLDGGLFMLVEEGKLDSLLVEMAGIDLMESVSLVMKRDLQQTDMRCGFVDIYADSGHITLKDFIIDTEDSLFLASGTVDLRGETIDVKFSPHPRDGSFLAATTPLHIVGSLSSPTIRPGAKLYTRVALAAAMAALAGPATIVLPFIEMGSGGEKSYCSELFGQ